MTASPGRSLGVDAGLILDTAHEAFVAMGVDGRIREWNRAAEQLFGWSREEVLGRELASVLIPERLRDAHRAGLSRFLDTGEGVVLERRLELPALRRDASEIDVEITISAVTAAEGRFFHAFLHDISERINRDRLLATQLRVTEALATAAPAQAPRLVLEALCRDGGWQYGGWWLAGDDAEVLHGYCAWWDEAEHGFRTFESASRAAGFHRGRGLPGLVWQTGEPVWHWQIDRSPDLPRYAAATRAGLRSGMAVPLRAGGEVVGVLEFFRVDAEEPEERQRVLVTTVAPQVAEYVARRRAERRASDAKDAFVAMVSHELRTPLTAINGFAQTALDYRELIDRAQIDEFLAMILQQGRRLTRLVDDLLTMSAIQSRGVRAELGEVDLEELVRETLEELGSTDRFQVAVDTEDPRAIADRDLCKQVIVNLTANAIRYGEPPYRVTIQSPRPEAARVVVSDCGNGVPKEFESKLFHRFTRADSVSHTPGTGLGLSIVRAVAEAQRGRVWYEPNEPRGARFVLELERPPSELSGAPRDP